jgi:hypothetical protein
VVGQAEEREVNRAEEWMESVSIEVALNRLVVDGMLPDRETMGWRPATGEGFLTLGSDELVVFEGYFYHRFGSLVTSPSACRTASLLHSRCY